MGPLSPSFPPQVRCAEILLSHGPGSAQHQGPPEPQVQHSCQRWPVPKATSSGVLLPQGDVFLGCNGSVVSATHPRRDTEVWVGLATRDRHSRAGDWHLQGPAHPGKHRRAPRRSLTELADVPVSGLAALVVPVEGS